jgi:two-component system, cell cycle sensor histidine kinase and response regulator CckA
VACGLRGETKLTFHARAEDATPEGAENLSELVSAFSWEAAIAAGLPDTCARGGKETILLVEDEALVRKATGEVLQSAGYKVVIAESAAQALEAYRESLVPVDLLLADVVMPGISGHELAQKFFLLYPQVRIVLMSGYMEQLALCQLSPYRTEYLAKPFSIATLLQRVREVLDRNPFDFGASA